MPKTIFYLLIMAIAVVSCFSANGQNLYLISVGNRYGFINNKGEVVIQPQYESAYYFSEGLATAKSGDFWGYIDTQGKFKIKPRFINVSSFKDDRALVFDQDNSGYVIDNSGKIIFRRGKDQYLSVFQENRASVMRVLDRKWGFVDYIGKLIVDYKYEDSKFTADFLSNHLSEYYPYVFLDDRIPVRLNGKFGFIDINGNSITDCIYDDVRYFHYGLTVVSLNGKSGLIDKNGKYVLPLEFDQIGQVTDSLISVRKNGKWGYVDHAGTLVIPYQYDYAESFRAERGKIVIKGANGKLKYGYTDKDGNQKIKPTYDNAYTYDSKGYAIVELGNKSGVINKKTCCIIQKKYQHRTSVPECGPLVKLFSGSNSIRRKPPA